MADKEIPRVAEQAVSHRADSTSSSASRDATGLPQDQSYAPVRDGNDAAWPLAGDHLHEAQEQDEIHREKNPGRLFDDRYAYEREAAEQEELDREDDPHWSPGLVSRFPHLGFGAIVVVLICAVGAVLTLQFSDGISQSRWPESIAPNVVIALLNNIANIAFGIAVGNGIAIAWWRKTLKGDTIRGLHRSWEFSDNVMTIVYGVRYFNVIALAALTTKLTIIDSALFQNAFSTEIRTDNPVQHNLTGYANTTIPNTGRVVSSGNTYSAFLAKNYGDDVKIWLQGGGILPNIYTGCSGTCYLQVPGAGFEIDCDDPVSASINYGTQLVNAATYLASTNCSNPSGDIFREVTCQQALISSTGSLFDVAFQPVYSAPGEVNTSYIQMEVLYTNATDTGTQGQSCPGTLMKQSCQLRPATVSYPVKIAAYSELHSTSTMSLAVDSNVVDNSTFGDYNATAKQQNHFAIVSTYDIYEDFTNDSRTRLGGIATGLAMYLGGNTTLNWNATDGYAMVQSGNAATYLANDLGVQTGGADITKELCGFQFVNPLIPQNSVFNGTVNGTQSLVQYNVPSLIGKINQIMFALALDISNEDDDKDVAGGTLTREATVYQDTIHYVTNHGYMWGAFASMIACIFCVLPVYWGYWQLGRPVTLGPFEIAAAFRAPNLHHPGNAPIEELIDEVGSRRVQFGRIRAGDAMGRIGIAEPEYVERIHPSAKGTIRDSWRQSWKSTRGTV